ncbi:hypothetical protein [Natranaerobius thermophilus]|uniref:DUF1440 domain-containing protein n=1 Tax=Natranaerobius thermophilus (strain ATCC BAA-1301 / DSM 18059 / JW/NM-WN-LF) TaxID=457570 RepID=B2A416_NATTJ|nr:hypothetical protein [Natranaerobius thermophilus]ACB85118.1 hypothetical protein Nther_1540 [Natranaerobius thermophilus JW/NM-WN-LF]
MPDRFYSGFISGILAGIFPIIINLGSLLIGLTTLIWSDFMSVYIIGRTPEGIWETLFFILVQFLFLGVLGIFFTFLLPHILSKRIVLKGFLYGIVVWLVLFTMPNILGIPKLEEVPIKTAMTHIISAGAWGVALALILNRINFKVSN